MSKQATVTATRPRLETLALTGCFGCHMSFLDLDEGVLEVLNRVKLVRGPLVDTRTPGPCALALVEGGVSTDEHVRTLLDLRERSQTLVALGACAVTGGVPSMRNGIPLEACLEEAFGAGAEGIANPGVPNDPELPRLLDRVYPLDAVVPVDDYLPGCPPSAAAIGTFLEAILTGRSPEGSAAQIRFD